MKLFMLILMTTQMVVDVADEINEEDQDSETRSKIYLGLLGVVIVLHCNAAVL